MREEEARKQQQQQQQQQQDAEAWLSGPPALSASSKVSQWLQQQMPDRSQAGVLQRLL